MPDRKPSKNLDHLMPTDDRMKLFWVSHLRYCLGNKNIRIEFEAETGITLWNAPQTPIEAMIDQATGNDGYDSLETFARWVNKNLWGEVDGRGCNGDEPETMCQKFLES